MKLDAPNLAYRLRWFYAVLWAFMLFMWGCWLYEPYTIWPQEVWWRPNHLLRVLLEVDEGDGLAGVVGLGEIGRSWPALLLYLSIFVLSHWLFLRRARDVEHHLPARRRLTIRAVGTVAFIAALLCMALGSAAVAAANLWEDFVIEVGRRVAVATWITPQLSVTSPWNPYAHVPEWWYGVLPATATAAIWGIAFVILAWRRPKRERFWQYERITLTMLAASLIIAISTLVAWKVAEPSWESETGLYTALALSLNVLLWAFGCRTILLFQLRRYQNSPREAVCFACGYDLRGSFEAGRRQCPECGVAVPGALVLAASEAQDGSKSQVVDEVPHK